MLTRLKRVKATTACLLTSAMMLTFWGGRYSATHRGVDLIVTALYITNIVFWAWTDTRCRNADRANCAALNLVRERERKNEP